MTHEARRRNVVSEKSQALSIRDVANNLGCSETKVRKDIRDRKLDFFRVGRSIRIKQQALDAYIERNTVQSVDAKAIARSILAG